MHQLTHGRAAATPKAPGEPPARRDGCGSFHAQTATDR